MHVRTQIHSYVHMHTSLHHATYIQGGCVIWKYKAVAMFHLIVSVFNDITILLSRLLYFKSPPLALTSSASTHDSKPLKYRHTRKYQVTLQDLEIQGCTYGFRFIHFFIKENFYSATQG